MTSWEIHGAARGQIHTPDRPLPRRPEMLSDDAQAEYFPPAQRIKYLPAPVSDAEIGRRARDALEYEVCVPIPNDRIHLSSVQGQIRVCGEVNWIYERQAVELALQRVKGVRGVVNDLTVRTLAPQVALAEASGNISGRKRTMTLSDGAARIARAHQTTHRTGGSVVESRRPYCAIRARDARLVQEVTGQGAEHPLAHPGMT